MTSKPSISARQRHPGGKIKQPTKAEREAAEKAREQAEKATVLAQPHRRGDTDQRCESALGSFVIRNKLRSELYDAGQAYADLVRRWRLVIGGVRIEGHKSLGADQHEVTRELADKLTKRVDEADNVLRRCRAYPWVRHIVVDYPTKDIRALPREAQPVITAGLFELAVHFGLLGGAKR
jgi:hypothetical protein